MIEIVFPQGKVALIDDEDLYKVNSCKWFARRNGSVFYAATYIGYWRERKLLQLHHLILGAPKKGNVIDHVNHNGLDCRKFNLRECSVKENCSNRTGYGASKYLGVSIANLKGHVYWRAFISVLGKQKYLGQFRTPEEAARAYDDVAKQTKGEFANLNFPDSAPKYIDSAIIKTMGDTNINATRRNAKPDTEDIF